MYGERTSQLIAPWNIDTELPPCTGNELAPSICTPLALPDLPPCTGNEQSILEGYADGMVDLPPCTGNELLCR